MEAVRPEQNSSRTRPIFSPVLSGAVVLLLDLSRLGIVGFLSTLLRAEAGWARRRRQ